MNNNRSSIQFGDNVVIGAGSVVTKDIPDWSIAAGNPCKVIRKITEEDRKYYYKDRKFDEEAWSHIKELGLGGDLGVGTICVAFCMGPAIQFCRERITDPLANGTLFHSHHKDNQNFLNPGNLFGLKRI